MPNTNQAILVRGLRHSHTPSSNRPSSLRTWTDDLAHVMKGWSVTYD